MDLILMGERIKGKRKNAHLTQLQLAEKINVTSQAVSSWERGQTAPDTGKLHELADLLKTTEAFLLEGRDGTAADYPGKIFDEKRMYTYLKGYADSRHMTETLIALPYAREKHQGQYRKGKGEIPYFIHPLGMACHALAMGITEDETIAILLLHDVCEDCGIKPENLPFSDTVREGVRVLTKTGLPTGEYYAAIAENPRAAIGKLLDRCSNVSTMVFGMDSEHVTSYIAETREYVLPLLHTVKKRYPQYSNQVHLLQYQICSLIDSIEEVMKSNR